MQLPGGSLDGKKGLVAGVANADSIAAGCARAFHQGGAELALAYLNDKALPHVEPVAREVEAPILAPLDVTKPDEMEALFERIRRSRGRLDFMLHSIAYCPKEDLHGRVKPSSDKTLR